jgi:signal transduction histidine kinase
MKNSINNISEISNLSESILDAVPYFIYITDKDGNVIYINKTGKSELQKGKLNLPSNVYEILDIYKGFWENGDKISKETFPVYRTLNYREEHKELTTKWNIDDTETYFSISSYPLVQNNNIIGAVVTVMDITEDYIKKIKVKNEREKFLDISTELKTKCDIIEILRSREKAHLMHLRDVINNISEGILVIDINEKLSLCNKAVFKILDLKAIELFNPKKITNKYEVAVEGYEGQNLRELYNFYIKGKKSIKNIIIKLKERDTLEEKYIEANSAPIVNKDDELVYTIVTIKDITEARIHEINAKEQADFVRDVVNTVDVPIAVVEYPSITYRLMNKKYEEIMKHHICEGLDNGVCVFNYNCMKETDENKCIDRELHKVMTNAAKNNRPYTVTPYRVKCGEDNDRFYKIKFIPFKNKDNTTRIHIHGSDVTEETNHNLELEKITQLKDEFFTITSHELRTPLTIIYSSLQLVYDIYGKEITPNVDKTLSRISQNCVRLLKLINNILDISKAEAGFLNLSSCDFDLVYISEAIVNSANSYANSKGIELIFDTNEEECNVRLDKDKYEKVLLNLLSNAIKFTPEEKQIIVTLNIQEENFYLSVKDLGVGIPKDKISSIFDRFAQVNSSLSRRAEGTGIGLALVKKLVGLMEGEISVTSELGEGTEFIVKFKKVNVNANHINNYDILTQNIGDRINIEFSDIN